MREVEFDPTTMKRATKADIERIYKQIWGVRRIHQTIDGTKYEVKRKGGRNRLPLETKLSKCVKGMVTERMRQEVDEWNDRGYSDTLIIQFAIRDWLDKQKSVQNTV